jgi:hypothetical protein
MAYAAQTCLWRSDVSMAYAAQTCLWRSDVSMAYAAPAPPPLNREPSLSHRASTEPQSIAIAMLARYSHAMGVLPYSRDTPKGGFTCALERR